MIRFLKYLFLQFYCMDMDDILWLMWWMTVGFLVICKYFGTRKWMKQLTGAALLCFLAVIAVATVGDRTGAGAVTVKLIPFHSYREVRSGGNPEIYRSNFMNAVLFYPAGLLCAMLLPATWPKWSRILLTTALFAVLSVGLEGAQYIWRLGRVEIDDVIHNTAGALAGSLAALYVPELLAWLAEKNRHAWEMYDYYRQN